MRFITNRRRRVCDLRVVGSGKKLSGGNAKFYPKGKLGCEGQNDVLRKPTHFYSMKLRYLSFHALAPTADHLNDRRRPGLSGKLPEVCAALLLAVGVIGPLHDAAAAPKAKATPTPTPTPTATATPTPEPTPTATPAPTATAPATPAPVANYSGTQQSQYIATARDAFVALRTAKSQPFLDAHKALDAAGSMSAKGLKTKEDITARRDLIAKTSAANDEYLTFITTQEGTYRAELAKTPLIPADVDGLVTEFANHANTPTMIKLRETERDALKAGDNMLATLEKKFGSWSVSDGGKVTFKKSADVSTMNSLSVKYNAKVAELQPLRDQLAATAAPSPSVTPGATPAASPTGAPVAAPAAKMPAPAATPAASIKP